MSDWTERRAWGTALMVGVDPLLWRVALDDRLHLGGIAGAAALPLPTLIEAWAMADVLDVLDANARAAAERR